MRNKKGFTLVEILIVVVILGILAAIVIPQFSDASTEAKTSSLKSDLQTVRSQIQLYKIQHNDELPGAGSGGTTATLIQALTGFTELDGDVWVAGDKYGPYIQQIPTNQFNSLSTIRSDAANDEGAGTHGWHFDTADGGFHADDTAAHAAL